MGMVMGSTKYNVLTNIIKVKCGLESGRPRGWADGQVDGQMDVQIIG